MFWRKKTAVSDEVGLHLLATQLGVEKRFSPRVQYPLKTTAGLPTITYHRHPLRMIDISVGGCALLDPTELFGAQVGETFDLALNFGSSEDLVSARLVGRVDHRRNFQFLNLAPIRAERLKASIGPGVRGSELRPSLEVSRGGPALEAIEVWSSHGGDSVTIESHLQRVASVYISGKMISVLRAAWPQDERHHPLSRPDFDALVLFLANVPRRSRALAEVLSILEDLDQGADT